LESALFINSFDSKDSNFKNQATPSSCHHRGNEEKNRKKSNPILYIHFNFGGNDKKKGKKKTICFGAL